MTATIQRVQRIDTEVGGHRVIALRYRISTDQFCPWLIAIGEAALPLNRNKRGRLLSRIYKETFLIGRPQPTADELAVRPLH